MRIKQKLLIFVRSTILNSIQRKLMLLSACLSPIK